MENYNMVFESLITPWRAEKRPWEMLFFGFLYASIAIALSLWIFKDHAGLISVFFTVMFCIPLMYNTLRMEEEKIDYVSEERSLIKEHSKALLFFVFLFMGMTFAFATWYVVMPNELSQSVFSVQSNTIVNINMKVTGNMELFSNIFFNNLKVLTFCLLFSFFFGAGAIFILTWNASVIAVAMGGLIKSYVYTTDSGIILAHIGGYSNAILRYFIHGIPEIIAYFVAALAGGIISVAIIRKDILTKNFQKIAFDTSNLIILAIIILAIAGLIEAYITPFFY
jgi:uncharacterized membrane protein SpoIIM required for sporulation